MEIYKYNKYTDGWKWSPSTMQWGSPQPQDNHRGIQLENWIMDILKKSPNSLIQENLLLKHLG